MSDDWMISVLDGEDLVAQAWQMSPEAWKIWLDSGEHLVVGSRKEVDTVLGLVGQLVTNRHETAYGREDPETGEPVPSVGDKGSPVGETFSLGSGPGRVAAHA